VDVAARLDLVRRHTDELITEAELAATFETHERPRAYIGFEPSGRLTVGHLVCVRKMRDLQEAGCELTVFLADWHAWINGKLGGSLPRIQAAGEYMHEAFAALGVDDASARWRWAHELTGSSEYWSRVIRVAKVTSLARTRRAMTILGRGEADADLDSAKLFYPSMQVADIFELPVEIAYAGRDQRRAHVLARETAHTEGWPVPVAVHTPLISSLKGGARMDPAADGADGKMSKSDPLSAIRIPSTDAEIAERVRGAFCPPKEVEGNPIVEIARHVVLPWEGSLVLERPAKHGGPRTFEDGAAFVASYQAGEIHPMDLKAAVTASLVRILAPARDYFASHPASLQAMDAAAPTS
jgi:tyrosyl-tRNA synthetase